MKRYEFEAEQFELFKPPRGSAIHPVNRKQDSYTVYTDGACWPNPGAGGWCALIFKNGQALMQLTGCDADTTNNRCEIMAVIEALSALPLKSFVTVYSDSQYVVNGANKWVERWERKSWTIYTKDPVKNVDLWRQIVDLKKERDCRFIWVRGHDGDYWNEECDKIASRCARLQRTFNRSLFPTPLKSPSRNVQLSHK